MVSFYFSVNHNFTKQTLYKTNNHHNHFNFNRYFPAKPMFAASSSVSSSKCSGRGF